MRHEPHPSNAPGPFYVERDRCFSCMAPQGEAPDLMGYEWAGCRGCYFRKQPSTPEELDRAIAATMIACCGAVRYGGNDPEVLQRLLVRGFGAACDALDDAGAGGSPSGITPSPAYAADGV